MSAHSTHDDPDRTGSFTQRQFHLNPLRWSIRAQLLALVLLSAIPLASLIAFTTYNHFDEEISEAHEHALDLAQITAATTASYIEARKKVLEHLAERPSIRQMDDSRCDPIFRDFPKLYTNFSNLLLVNMRGEVVCSSQPVRLDNPPNYQNAENFKRIIASNGFIVGSATFGAISQRWILPIGVPVHHHDGQVIGTLTTTLDLVRFQPATSAASLPDGTVIALINAEGIMLSRNTAAEQWVGKKVAAHPIMASALVEREGSKRGAGLDGADNVFAYSPVPGTDWIAVTGLNAQVALRFATASAWKEGVLELAFLVFIGLLALIIARRIESPIRAIAVAARRVAGGHLETRVSGEGPAEISEVARQFNRMLDKRLQYEQTLLRTEQRLRLAMNAALMGSWEWDVSADQMFLSASASGLLGGGNRETETNLQGFLSAVHADDREALNQSMQSSLQSGGVFQLEHRLQRGGGNMVWLVIKGSPLPDENGKLSRMTGILMDITERKRNEEQIHFLATHDPLTNLCNRREFDARLRAAIARARSVNSQHALLYMDLDQFKIVNDTCGHSAGDALLRQLTADLITRLRESDTLARLGGDEFGVLLENCPLENALKAAESLRDIVREFRFAWNGRVFQISVSIGLVPITDNNADLEQIMSLAEGACYIAKEQGRDRVHAHLTGDDTVAQRRSQLEWTARIDSAIANSEFSLYFQAIKPIHTGAEGLHGEILLRMHGSGNETIPPSAFILAAERYGKMPPVDRWVIASTFAFLDKHPQLPIHTLSINISGSSLNEQNFLTFICEQLASHAIRPQSICFEITETAAIINLSEAQMFMKELRGLGCRFALDDFGAGMSSFAYLKHFPVDYLKIDGSFVRNMDRDPSDLAMVRAIHQIGHVLGMKTIAEFVHNETILSRLRAIGVDYAQGYAVARPMPLARLLIAAVPDAERISAA